MINEVHVGGPFVDILFPPDLFTIVRIDYAAMVLTISGDDDNAMSCEMGIANLGYVTFGQMLSCAGDAIVLETGRVVNKVNAQTTLPFYMSGGEFLTMRGEPSGSSSSMSALVGYSLRWIGT